jgi:hypothetical protein
LNGFGRQDSIELRRREREEYLDGKSGEWRLREHAVIDTEIEI